jgi:hypothetical protein
VYESPAQRLLADWRAAERRLRDLDAVAIRGADELRRQAEQDVERHRRRYHDAIAVARELWRTADDADGPMGGSTLATSPDLAPGRGGVTVVSESKG